jgi:hypothetical protein
MNTPIVLGTVLIFLAVIGIAGSWVMPLLIGGLALVAFGAYVVPVKPPPVKPLQDDER